MPALRSGRIGHDWTETWDASVNVEWNPIDVAGNGAVFGGAFNSGSGLSGTSVVHTPSRFDGAFPVSSDGAPLFGGCPCPGCALSEKIFKAEILSFSSPLGDEPLFLGDDIADDMSTTTSIALGGTLSSAIQTPGDLDYIRVSLVAGQTYTFSMVGTNDAYLELRDNTGALVAQDDDGGILFNSLLMHRATQTGNYFIVARGFDASVTGNYTLSVNAIPTGNTSPTTFPGNSLPQYSWDEAAIQISRTGSSWASSFGAPVTITYAFRSSAPATMPDDTGGFTRFSAAQIAATEAALAAWAAVANITFVRVNDGDGYSDNASILFANYSTGAEGAAAFAYLPNTGNTSAASVQGDVWINSTLSYNINPVAGEYGQQVLLHEIGHALGLSHPAAYNAGPGQTIEYGTHAVYFNDSRMFTTMSYFASSNTGATLPAFASLPQLHDIAAIQRLYGANMASRAGDTIYGFNSNTGVAEYTLALASQGAVFTVWDGGGLDTLDLSGYSTNSTIDLRQEAFSSAGPASSNGSGLAVFNISIARGAVIENAIGGAGNDTITGNSAGNLLLGGAGADTLIGLEGHDLLDGGADTDTMSGGQGDDVYVVDQAGDVIVESANEGTDRVYSYIDYELSINLELLNLLGTAYRGAGNDRANHIVGTDIGNRLEGMGGDDIIEGRGGHDWLDGWGGADTLIGGTGDDVYVVDQAGDVIVENANEGTDRVYSYIDYELSINLELLNLLGTAYRGAGNDRANHIVGTDIGNRLEGMGGDDIIEGRGGHDWLDGWGGADTLIGGTGDDVYVVDQAGDVIVENANEGTDRVYSYISYTLDINLELLTLLGSSDISATGNSRNNHIIGNGGNNTISGRGGNDLLEGGAGDDLFVFAPGDGSDRIVDFAAGGTDDEIDLSAYAGTGITWTITQLGADTLFAFSNGDSITLLAVTATDLTHPSDYIYG
jgi:serralysin